MNKKILKMSNLFLMFIVMFFCMSMSANAEGDSESTDTEQLSFIEGDEQLEDIGEPDQYVDGIYNIGAGARANMSGVIRLYQSGTKLASNYSTVYSYAVDKIGVKNITLQYKGSLGLWHTIITLDDRYFTNSGTYQGAFSCNGVVGRTYRVKGTHYIINGSYSEYRDNVTLGLTFE